MKQRIRYRGDRRNAARSNGLLSLWPLWSARELREKQSRWFGRVTAIGTFKLSS